MIELLLRLRSRIAASNIFKSVFRHGYPDTDMNRSLVVTSNLFLHVFPVKVKRNSLRFWFHLGLGAASLLLFVLLVATGVLLMLYYTPQPLPAYRSLKDLQFAVFGGRVLRNFHRWSAHLMVATVFLHLCRVFLTGSYKKPREFNWVIGVLLL
ncbi:MAG: cytochrome b N-terminal domain-containing protein, partial [Candidatus Wallbacteria bacterium]|nr:cytochrome b N-terminal domain-containing protein [Candidatus Wallbacteria bacterium]